MKKSILIALLALLCFVACEPGLSEDESQRLNTVPLHPSDQTTRGGFSYPDNQIVVQYDAGLSEAEKQQLRNNYGVISFKTCPCADPTLELWIFGPSLPGDATIEDARVIISEESELEGADFNPIFQHDGTKLTAPFGPSDVAIAMDLVVSGNENVTIAVLDTGVDYNYHGFTEPFLYNSISGGNICTQNEYEDYFGWDFVNQDNNPFDDHGHGTIITEFISNQLEEKGITYQILPVKAFDYNGNGHYFDILCSFKYAVNIEAVDVVNMSFGWYHNQYELLQRFVFESQGDVLITASAGNNGIDNDLLPHYPSSYDSANIIASAALSIGTPTTVSLAYFSNYGMQSVDLAATGEHIPFYITPNEYILVSGTSYSNAFMSAHAGITYQQGMSVPQHYDAILNDVIYHPNLEGVVHYASYINY